jgi:hypothetical protein
MGTWGGSELLKTGKKFFERDGVSDFYATENRIFKVELQLNSSFKFDTAVP